MNLATLRSMKPKLRARMLLAPAMLAVLTLGALPTAATASAALRAPLQASAKELRFSADDDGVQMVQLCTDKTGSSCGLAPNGTYVTARGLRLTIDDGVIVVEDMEYFTCAYERPARPIEHFILRSDDGAEYITCEDRG
jgi:hypothetical protein